MSGLRLGFASMDWSLTIDDPSTGYPAHGGANWARMGMVAKHLRKRGHEVTEGSLVAKGPLLGVRTWDGEHHFDFDVLVLQRWMFGDLPDKIAATRDAGVAVTNDLDDWFWGLPGHNPASACTEVKANPIENRKHYYATLAASTAVSVSTPYLARRLVGQWGDKVPVTVIANTVDCAQLRPLAPSARRQPSLGWVGAQGWKGGDIAVIRGILGPFAERQDLPVYHGGHYDAAPSFADLAGVDHRRMTVKPLCPIWEYPELFTADVGLIPLLANPFNEAKSNLSGLYWAALGRPFVASATAAYRELASLGAGRVARRPHDWRGHLTALLDPDVRTHEAKLGREAVEEHYDIAEGVVEWERFYASLVD